MTHASASSDVAAVSALVSAWNAAIERRDLDGIVASYTSEAVFYGAIPPGRIVGKDAIRDLWAQCLPHFPERFRSVHKDLEIVADGNVAFVHGLHRFEPEEPHPCGDTWVRVSVCFRRRDGRWTVAHEHASIPFDPCTMVAQYLGDDAEARPAQPTDAGPPVHKVTPHIVCDGASDAIAFYEQAFGAREMFRLAGPDGRLLNACISLNGGLVMLVDSFPEMGAQSPKTLGGSPVSLHMAVPDVDAAFARAVEAGATAVCAPADMFWGDRYGLVEDPFGHRWSLATPIKTLTADEIRAAAAEAMKAHGATCG